MLLCVIHCSFHRDFLEFANGRSIGLSDALYLVYAET